MATPPMTRALVLAVKSALWWALVAVSAPFDVMSGGALDLHFWPERHACRNWRRAKEAYRG